MHDILSEGREIDPRCQLEPAIALRSKREERIWKRNRNARPRTTIDARNGRASVRAQSEVRKRQEKETRFEKDVD